jgi:hypothetical protein
MPLDHLDESLPERLDLIRRAAGELRSDPLTTTVEQLAVRNLSDVGNRRALADSCVVRG